MRIIAASSYRKMPWKNGGGTTAEILVFPDGAGLADFDWRISMASVAQDGPFSLFPGIDRTLCVLDGKGLELAIAGAPPVTLSRRHRPAWFAADVPVEARLLRGPITDLNVMTRRGRCWHHVARERIRDDYPLGPPSRSHDITVVVLTRGEALATCPGERLSLTAPDTLVIDVDTPGEVSIRPRAGTLAEIHIVSIGAVPA